MRSPLKSKAPLMLMGLLVILLLALACAKAEEGAAPAPAAPSGVPAAAPAAAPAPAPVAAPTPAAPVTAPRPAAPVAVETTGAAPTLAVDIKLDPRVIEPGSTMAQEVLKYHHSKLPLWEKAKYGGERRGVGGTFNVLGMNPFTVFSKRNTYMGMFIMIDAGTCSSIGRTDFSRCNGVRNNNLTGVLVPGIVEKWDRPDPLTVVFTIRQGVLWPNLPPMSRVDRSVTVEDVKWYFETQKKEGIYKDTFALVDAFEVVDRRTLRLKFSQPHATFIPLMANYGLGIIPRDCYENREGCLNKRLISPGPFIWDEASYVPRSKAIFVKNEEFWLNGLPYLDRLVTVSVTDVAARKAAFVTGQFDQFETNSPRERDVLLKQVPKAQIQTEYCSCGSNNFQMRMDKPPLNDVRVRRALSMGIDRPKAWLAGNDGYNALGMPMAFDFLGLELFVSLKTAGPYYQYNPAEAKRLLTEAGLDKGFAVPVWTGSLTSWAAGELITSIQDDWQKLGVNLKINLIDAQQHSKLHTSKDWEGFWYSPCYECNATDPDSYYLMAYSKSPRNDMGINDPVVDELYLKARSELDETKRTELHWKFTLHMYDQVYGIHFANPSAFTFFAPWLRNAASHVYAYAGVTNFSSWVMWIDPDLGYLGPK